MKHTPEFTERDITRILTTPLYTGIQVHPDLTVARPIYREKYIAIAQQSIKDFGARPWLYDFLLHLRHPDTWALLGIRAGKVFTLQRLPIITEDQFMEASTRLMDEIGVVPYINSLLDNLEGE